jgi:hypothetical protein
MVPDLPGWDSLPAVTRFHNWAEIIGIVAVAILVVAEIIAYQLESASFFVLNATRRPAYHACFEGQHEFRESIAF